LGTKGKIKDIMGAMKDVPKEMKREAGLMLNELKQKAEEQKTEKQKTEKQKTEYQNTETQIAD
jgi:phenylalanyl-tRNA synthetase alpha chain